MSSTPRTWTLDEYFERAERRGLLSPHDRPMVEALARADYFVQFLLEDLPGVIVEKSSAYAVLDVAVTRMRWHREGRSPKPYDLREKGGN